MRNKNLNDAYALALTAAPLDYAILLSNYDLRSDNSTLLSWLKGLHENLIRFDYIELVSKYNSTLDYIATKSEFLFEYSQAESDTASEIWDIAIGRLIDCVTDLISIGESISTDSIRRRIKVLLGRIDGDRYLTTLIYTFVDQQGVVSYESLKEAVLDCIKHEVALKIELLERIEKQKKLEATVSSDKVIATSNALVKTEDV